MSKSILDHSKPTWDSEGFLNISLLTRNPGSPSEITSIVFLPIVSKASIPSETNSSPLLVTALDNDVKPQEEKKDSAVESSVPKRVKNTVVCVRK